MSKYAIIRDGMTNATEGDILRQVTNFLAQAGVVFHGANDLKVTAQTVPDMTVKVAEGGGYILNSSWSAYSSAAKFWPFLSDAVETPVTIGANSSGSTRVDLICAKFDTAASPDANASNVVTFVVVAGTPGAGAPATPSNHLKLAEVTVVNGASSISNSDITDRRVPAGYRFDRMVLPQDVWAQAMTAAGAATNLFKINTSNIFNIAIKTLFDAGIQTDFTDYEEGSAPATPSSGVARRFTDANGTPRYKSDGGFDSNVELSQFMARQALINGNFDIWQRDTSETNPAVGQFLADRWKMTAVNTGSLPTNIVHSRQAITPGDILNSFYHYRIAPDGAGSGFGANDYYGIEQRIEFGTRFLGGLNKKVTVAFYAKSSIASKKLGVRIKQNYGSGGSPSSAETVNGSNFTLTSSWVRCVAVMTLNTLVGKTFGTANDDYLGLEFLTMWGSSQATSVGAGAAETFVGSGNIDIAQVTLNQGDVPLDFQPRPYPQELALCQRYYEKSFDIDVLPVQNVGNSTGAAVAAALAASTIVRFWVQFKVTKRDNPTVTLYNANAANAQARDQSAGADCTSTAADVVGMYGCQISATTPGGSVIGNAVSVHWDANAEL